MFTSDEWLSSLKAEDRVIVYDNRGNYVANVARVTNTQIVLVNGRKYRRNTGHQIGAGAWDGSSLGPVTEELLNEIRKKNLVYYLNHTSWERLSLDVLRQIKALIPPEEDSDDSN